MLSFKCHLCDQIKVNLLWQDISPCQNKARYVCTYYSTKPKGRICLVVVLADTAFGSDSYVRSRFPHWKSKIFIMAIDPHNMYSNEAERGSEDIYNDFKLKENIWNLGLNKNISAFYGFKNNNTVTSEVTVSSAVDKTKKLSWFSNKKSLRKNSLNHVEAFISSLSITSLFDIPVYCLSFG